MNELIIAVTGLPILLWIGFTTIFHGKRFEMDHGSAQYSFFGIFTIYRRLAFVIFGIGLILSIVSAHRAWPPGTVILAAAAIDAFLFNFWAAVCYESYLHVRYPRQPLNGSTIIGGTNYAGWKYALTLALAASALILFVGGLCVFLATVLGR